jgi:outer membrane protein TolC
MIDAPSPHPIIGSTDFGLRFLNGSAMSTEVRITCAAVLCVVLAGCGQSRQYYFFKDEDLTHYRQVALEIETPAEPACHVPPGPTAPPINPETFEKMPLWDLRLEEAIAMAVGNSKIVRRLPAAGPPGFLLDNAQSLITTFDPAIQAAGVPGSGGGIGVEAALAAFDAQLTTSMLWERNERPVNVGGGIAGQIFARDFVQDRATFQGELSKTNATGGRTFVRHNVIYDYNNNPTRGVPSSYDINYEVGINQPLLQGAGVAYNRIVGPNQGNIAPIILSGGGVLIARINEDISLTDFEKAMRDMVFDVETAYWDLYVAYRDLDSIRAGRDAALANWRRVKAFQQARVIGGEALLLAQARSQYYQFDADLQTALRNLLAAENRLRYMLGVPASDCRLIRPKDDPQRAKVLFDWCDIHVEALARSVELRRQKWVIQRRELELIAARNLLLPRLDAVALYRWLGAGDTLIDPNGPGVPPFAGSNAYATLTDGNYQEWQMGFNFSMPLGFRQQMVTVRNVQLQIARERARLEGQELEVSHALTEAVRNVECQYVIAQRRLDQLYATQEEYQQFDAIWKSGVQRIGRLEVRNTDVIDALARRAVAESAFYRALVDYNRAIAEVHLRKGSLLEYNRVFLAEGPSPHCAYRDARDKELRRYPAWPLNYAMRVAPGMISQGPHPQTSPEDGEVVPGPGPHSEEHSQHPEDLPHGGGSGLNGPGRTLPPVEGPLNMPGGKEDAKPKSGVPEPPSASSVSGGGPVQPAAWRSWGN